MDNLTGGHQGQGRDGYAVEIVQDPFGHRRPAPLGDDGLEPPGCIELHPEQGRDIDAVQVLQGLPQLLSGAPVRLPGRNQRRQLQDDFLPVAQHKGVKEGRHRLGIETGRAAADDHRVAAVAVRGQQGHAAQVQHVQEIGVAQFVLETHSQEVIGVQGRTGLQAGQGLAPGPEVRLQVRGRGIGPFGPDVLLPVQDAVEQPQPQVGHTHFVEIGEQQAHPQGYGPGVFYDRVDLPAQVTAGPLDAMQKIMIIGTGHGKSFIIEAPPGAW